MRGSRRPRLINCLLPTGKHDLPCPPQKKEPPTCDPAAHLFHATLTCLFIFKVDKGIADVVLGHWVYGQVKEVEWPWLWGPFDRQAPAFQIVSNHTLKDHKDYNMTLHNSVIYWMNWPSILENNNTPRQFTASKLRMTRHSPGPLAPSTCSRDRSGWAHFGASVSLYRLDILSPWWLGPWTSWTECVSISAGFCRTSCSDGSRT